MKNGKDIFRIISFFTSTSLKTSRMSGLRARVRWLNLCLTVWLRDRTRLLTASAWAFESGLNAAPNSSGWTSRPAFQGSVNSPKPAAFNHSASSSPSVNEKSIQFPVEMLYSFYGNFIIFFFAIQRVRFFEFFSSIICSRRIEKYGRNDELA